MRAALAIVSCSLVMVGCEGSPFPTSPAPKNPVASASVVTPATVTASAFMCGGLQLVDRDVTLVVTAGRSNVFLDTVSLRLGDGSNINGQSVTFPRAGLDAQFGSTLVRVGNSRSFLLRPAFACASLRPRLIAADIVVVDESGVRRSMAATVSLP